MKKGNVIIKNASQVVTCSGSEGKFGKDMNNINVIENASVVVEDGIIKEIGSLEDICKKYNEKDFEVIDASNKVVLPGFVDSHTHFVFGGFRAEEFSWRLNGESYMDIMNKGGGIVNSVRGTREATEDELYESGKKRLDSMIHFGVTTVEGKSGYGLDCETELKQLRVMDRLQKDHPIDICKTFMGAHATPEEYKGRNEEYINFIIEDVLPKVAEEKLAEFCDVFCEEGVFSVEESRKILLKAKELGMKIKLHADEIVQLGGAELAAELGATSADHLLHASDEGIKAMADKKVIATLLPTTAFCLKEPFARARMMIDKGGAVALGTDFNPGSGFTNSIPLMFALATIYMNMSIEEAISAMTINGAAAIGRAETIGSIDKGKKGDLVILEYPSYKFLPYNTGVNIVETVIKDGNIVYKKSY
ncbi:imidazolonepropionase [Clostridium tetani]|uniref:Imidazolonepropionase n=1 Tax=Clostridium tetani TaxID=1513 RepID=A0ABY0EQQ3_CLOTA|nr:imidazolonepropionase [Clostridium tetani]CDI50506.1 imidazolonepropionase [Clostridium tetani 12124569]KHO32606.1 imidazolonepropionase [Clostridium tetani]RXI39303.1 imidazolonepropionase [Clostridium tetani]RXI57336.1 imidazolonepropionase [Clostridium tetani]RXI66914.1 imidazolonepropionase [Clostridium tetani]